MANLSTFFGQAVASGVSSELTDPSKIPFIMQNGHPYLSYGGYSQYAWYQHEFWSETEYNNSGNLMVRLGDWVEQTTDDQAWYTITDVSSSAGYWCWAVGFGSYGTADWATDPITSSLRVTIDGTAYTREANIIHTNCNPASTIGHQCPVWGWTSERQSQTGTYRERYKINDGPAGYFDYATHRSEEMSNRFGGETPSNYGTPKIFYQTAPGSYLQGYRAYTLYTLPKVRFENSLKVEAKITRACPGVVNGTYRNGPNTEVHNSHYYTNRAASFHYLDTPVTI
jgi:hypothetical protein